MFKNRHRQLEKTQKTFSNAVKISGSGRRSSRTYASCTARTAPPSETSCARWTVARWSRAIFSSSTIRSPSARRIWSAKSQRSSMLIFVGIYKKMVNFSGKIWRSKYWRIFKNIAFKLQKLWKILKKFRKNCPKLQKIEKKSEKSKRKVFDSLIWK